MSENQKMLLKSFLKDYCDAYVHGRDFDFSKYEVVILNQYVLSHIYRSLLNGSEDELNFVENLFGFIISNHEFMQTCFGKADVQTHGLGLREHHSICHEMYFKTGSQYIYSVESAWCEESQQMNFTGYFEYTHNKMSKDILEKRTFKLFHDVEYQTREELVEIIKEKLKNNTLEKHFDDWIEEVNSFCTYFYQILLKNKLKLKM